MDLPCEYCLYYEYDEEYDEYTCQASPDMDEDDYGRLMGEDRATCPFFRAGNEYTIVNKQI